MTPAGAWPEVVALVSLAAILVFAMAQPKGLPEATAAIPVAGSLVWLGVVTPLAAWQQITLLGPTVGFLAAILVLAHLADAEGVFEWLGARLALAARGRPRRLLGLVFLAASITTAVLSLDATVVLLTPVVFATAARVRARPRPHVYACTHLANSASQLLPASNLTNLLAFTASGLSFAGFAALMGLPWVVAIAAEYVVFLRFFRSDLPTCVSGTRGRATLAVGSAGDAGAAGAAVDGGDTGSGSGSRPPVPVFAFVVLGLALAGFGVSGLLGVEPVWVAVAADLVLAVPALIRRRVGVAALFGAAAPLFCLFVLALGVVVAGVSAHGLGDLVAAVLPTGISLPELLLAAALAAVLANVVNNLPATLLLLGALTHVSATHPVSAAGSAPLTGSVSGPIRAGLVLAVLIGVNIGPNLTYTGSLATLLWRRVLAGRQAAPALGEFLTLGALTVPLCLIGAVVALWLGLTLGQGWLL